MPAEPSERERIPRVAVLLLASVLVAAPAAAKDLTCNAQDPALEAARIKAWCEGEAREFIRAFIGSHDSNHEGLLARVEQARR